MMSAGDETLGPDWRRLEAALTRRLAGAEAEIRSYPSPIPACDAQFNHLLAQRSGIPGEIRRLREAALEAATTADAQRAVEEFVLSCPYLDRSDLLAE